jgi:uncharacterized protein
MIRQASEGEIGPSSRQSKRRLLREAEEHARSTYPPSDWPHIAEVVDYARRLAVEVCADQEIVALAAYFHDISRATCGPESHNVHSAAIAREWLSERGYPARRTARIAAAIIAHMRPEEGPTRETLPLEGRVLYDADKISRAQGLGLVGALVRLGQQTPWEELSYVQLAAAIRRGREVTSRAYRTLYTEAARELAGPEYRRTMEFCDCILELHAFRSTPESTQLPQGP